MTVLPLIFRATGVVNRGLPEDFPRRALSVALSADRENPRALIEIHKVLRTGKAPGEMALLYISTGFRCIFI